MKGVILAGGTGSRLRPVTLVTNKHLLPVYDRPMIYYPLQLMSACGFKEVLIVSGREHAGDFLNLLGSGKEFGLKLSYEVQEEAGGIAEALYLAKDFADQHSVSVCLGDNIFGDYSQLITGVERFKQKELGAMIFLKEVLDPQRFGVAEIGKKMVIKIEEKPQNPKTNLSVTGFYIFDKEVFKIIENQKPSVRGEMEITDVNNAYIQKKQMSYELIKGQWTDAGTFESLFKASEMVRKKCLIS